MRILLLTQWFDPEPTFKGLVFARELARLGFEVEVVTGVPNYPGGKLYPGYRLKWLQQERIDGVDVTRVPLYPSHDRSAIGRVLNYVSFAVTSLIYVLFGARRPDVVYAYHPPLTVGLAASLIRVFKRVPVVYDVQDMWPDTLRATGMVRSERLLGIVGSVCKWVYRRVDNIVVLSPGFKRLLLERGGREDRIDVIYNWCDETSLASPSASAAPILTESNHFDIVFAGNLGKAQALHAVVEAAEVLAKCAPNIRFVFVGRGVERESLQRLVAAKELQNVIFIPQVPMTEVGAILQQADALLVHLKDDPLFSITIPSKTQAYMAIGRPILMAVPGDAADLIQSARCGVVAKSENPSSIADAARTLESMDSVELAAMGRRGQEFYQAHMSLEAGCRKFSSLFASVVKQDSVVRKDEETV